MRSLSLLLLIPAVCAAQPPKGELSSHTFAASKIFPGTTRTFTVYVPAQYDGKTPACLWVNQDAVQFKAPDMFDQLIAAKEMPVTIGVFVSPGIVPATHEGALPRFNRSFEYDGLGDAYARFLIEELLPAVEKLKTKDGRAIKLSRNPDDRAISGSSSGAIAAFTAAWERPDSFRRVFSNVGTFVGLRGGNVYPTLIRKTEPKPLRVFLADGEADNNIYGGDWWMANQEMERALTFAGYEVAHDWAKAGPNGYGGHNQQHATKIFPDAVKWLWKDHGKAPIKAGKGSPQMQSVLLPDEGWKLVAEGLKFTEGPIANAKGEVLFVDVPDSRTYHAQMRAKQIDLVGQFNADNGKASGLAFGTDGALYGVGGGLGALVRYEPDNKRTVIADGIKGNDVVALHNGDFYITAPGSPDQIIHVRGGKKTVVDTGLQFSNGITVSPDQSLLYVAESRTHWVWSYQIQPDGSLKHKQRYFHLHAPDTADNAWADGLKCDTDGRLYVATNYGIQFCDQAGRVNGIIHTPNGKSANLCFGGPKFDTIYVTAFDKVYSRKVKTTGVNTFAKPTKPTKPRL